LKQGDETWPPEAAGKIVVLTGETDHPSLPGWQKSLTYPFVCVDGWDYWHMNDTRTTFDCVPVNAPNPDRLHIQGEFQHAGRLYRHYEDHDYPKLRGWLWWLPGDTTHEVILVRRWGSRHEDERDGYSVFNLSFLSPAECLPDPELQMTAIWLELGVSFTRLRHLPKTIQLHRIDPLYLAGIMDGLHMARRRIQKVLPDNVTELDTASRRPAPEVGAGPNNKKTDKKFAG
jgi:hypothetical protein